MKYSILFLMFSSLYYSVWGQLQPNAKEALLRIHIKSISNKPILEEVKIKGRASGKSWNAQPNEVGTVEILVPIQNTYDIYLSDGYRYAEFNVGNTPNNTQSTAIQYNGKSGEKMPNLDMVLIEFQYTDLKDKHLANEELALTSEKTKKVYRILTDGKAPVRMFVPRNDTYTATVKYDTAFKSFQFPNKSGMLAQRIRISGIGTIAWEARVAEKARIAKEREEKYLADKKKREEEGKNQEKARLSKEWVAAPGEENLEKIIARNKNNWNYTTIVIDVTGSMEPYNQQVMSWLKKRYSEGLKLNIVLFNDGNNCKNKTSDKGVYVCRNCEPEQFLDTLVTAKLSGNNCEVPENNMEALFVAAKEFSNAKEIVMIVDNYSDIRDFSLMREFVRKNRIPLHIIVCGLNDNPVNEDYLNLAYHTKGSIHTIEQDLNIGSTIDGSKIKIAGVEYILKDGRFYIYK